MIVFPIIISTVLGLLTLTSVIKEAVAFPLLLTLSVGIGLGVSSILSFFSFLLLNQYQPLALIGLNVLQIGILFAFHHATWTKLIKFFDPKIFLQLFRPKILLAALLWTIIAAYTIFIANLHPYGEWDAWALWNMKLKFLNLGGENWKDIFGALHWHTQPDYPLLLPFLNSWGLSFSPTPYPDANTPLITGLLFTFLTIFLLYYGLSRFIPKSAAYWAASLCFVNPYFVFKATSQYADTVFAFYLLCSLVLLSLSLQTKKDSFVFLTGLLLGLLTFTKNEGIVISILLSVILFLLMIIDQMITLPSKKSLFYSFLKGFLLTASATIILKIFLAPPNRDILTNGHNLPYMNWNGFATVIDFLWKETIDKRWGNIWPLVFIGLVLGAPKLFRKETRPLTLFFFAYSLVLLMIYLTTSTMDLSWRLKNTIPRIFFYLLPSLLFLCFLTHFKNDEQSIASKKLKKTK